MINNTLIPNYADGYEIRYDRPNDVYRCFQNDARLKRNGKAFQSKRLDRAKEFMAELGAKEVAKPVKLWTPPAAAVIAPLVEQLAALPADRFVVVEAGYGTYKELGYAVYDRQQEKIIGLRHHAWNDVTDIRENAVEDVAFYNENPPVDGPELNLYLFNEIFGDEIRRSGDAQPEMSIENLATYERQKAEAEAARAAKAVEVQPVAMPAKQLMFVTDRQYGVGETIEDEGETYTVIEESFYLSQKDVDDLDDMDVFGVQAGWQTKVERK